jgi:hypothetical protein
MVRVSLALVVLASGLSYSGCAAIAIPPAAVGAAAVSGSAGGLVRAGTEYTMAGAAYRTFSSPVKDVYEAVHETFQKLQITPTKESFGGGDVTIQGVAIDRKFTITLDPITPTLTRMKLVVSQHGIGKDRATAGEIISQVEQRLRPPASASPPLE